MLKLKAFFFVRLMGVLALSIFLGACSVYYPDVSQGNVVTSNMVSKLKRGMGSVETLQIMGTPLVVSVFHPARWDYVFLLEQDGKRTQTRRLTLYFKEDRLDRIEGDKMPSERQFLAQVLANSNSLLASSWLAEASGIEVAEVEGEEPILEDVSNQGGFNQPEAVSVDVSVP